ncbi:MAG TPA: hypothetical protein VHA79_10850 [Mycobacteriales bacterium]|jgi:hypothetical protein|nr:hypothetical protein [Mycobacteriales bacterium]
MGTGREVAGRSKRALAPMVAAVAVIGSGIIAVPSALAAPATDAVTSQSLQSSYTHVVSSTGRKLQVQLNVEQPAAAPSGATATITLRKGSSETSELHVWTFPVTAAALQLDASGAGTVDVPDSAMSPFGQISLTSAPVGDPTTQTCKGQNVSRTQAVSLTGTFFFDTRSKGRRAWGTVGSTTEPFSFGSPNKVVSQYNPGAGSACVDFNNLPCPSGVFWSTNEKGGALNFEGVTAGRHGELIASRTVDLSTPPGATRNDESFATTKPLKLTTTSGGGASLSVKADTNSSGRAKLIGKSSSTDSNNCKDGTKKKVETTTFWRNAKYKNGTKHLAVHEQIFGAIKIANNSNGSLTSSTIS